MRNKKVIALTVLFMFLLSSVCMAAHTPNLFGTRSSVGAYQPDTTRWLEIYSDDEVEVFYDMQTLDYYNDEKNIRSCDVWIMYVHRTSHTIHHYIVKENRMMALLAYVKYDDGRIGGVVGSNSWSSPEYDAIIPGSIGEGIYERFFYK